LSPGDKTATICDDEVDEVDEVVRRLDRCTHTPQAGTNRLEL